MQYKLFTMLLFLAVVSQAQNYWAHEYDLAYREAESAKNIFDNDSLLIVTGGLTCESNTKYCHKFSVIDTTGKLLYYTTYDSLIYPPQFPVCKGLLKIDNLFISAGISTRSPNEICIIAHDILGNVVKSKFLTNPYDSTLFIVPTQILKRGSEFILFANIYGEANTEAPWGYVNLVGIFNIDPTTFDVLSYRIIHPEEYLVYFMDAKVDADSLLYVSLQQQKHLGSPNNIVNFSQILKLDGEFNTLDNIITTEPNFSDNNDRIAIGHDGRIVMARQLDISSIVTDELHIFNMDTGEVDIRSLDILTDPNRGMISYDILGMKTNENGETYMYGYIKGLGLDYTVSAYLVRLDADYNIDRERIFLTNTNEHYGFDFVDGFSDHSIIQDILFKPNGDILFGGSITDDYSGASIPNWNLFVGVLDANGCISENCEVEQYVGGHYEPDNLVLPGKTWHIYDEYRGETYRLQLSRDSFYIKDRYYLELYRSDSQDGNDFYSTGMYMRERSLIVYLRKDNQDFLLYNLDLSINSWLSSWIYEEYNASHQLVARDTVVLENGDKARREKLRCSIDEGAEDYGYYYWIQGVGDTKGLLAIGEACIEERNSHLLCVYDGEGVLLWDNPDFEQCWVISSTKDLAQKSITIYPNPTGDVLSISGYDQVKEYTIYDIDGRVVLSGRYSKPINVQNLITGLYTIRLTNTTGKVEVQKFVKL